MKRPPIPEFYLPMGARGNADLIIRSVGDPRPLSATIISEVRALDRTAVVSNIETIDEHLDFLLAPRRFETLLLSLFALTAMLLAAIGIYGAADYAVRQRIREIGLRIALGARPIEVIRMLLVQSLPVLGLSLGAGLIIAVILGRFMRSLLYEIAPTDAITLVAVPLILMIVAFAATLLPAGVALRIDPLEALRHE